MRDYKLTKEMKQVLQPILEDTVTKNEERVAPLAYCAMAPLEELCVTEEDVDLERMQWLHDAVRKFKEYQNQEAYRLLLDQVHDCMVADGAVLIPVREADDEWKWGSLRTAAEEIWLPVFTSMEKTPYWLAEGTFHLIPLSDAIMHAAAMQSVTGMVLDPVSDDILLFADTLHYLAGEFLNYYSWKRQQN